MSFDDMIAPPLRIDDIIAPPLRIDGFIDSVLLDRVRLTNLVGSHLHGYKRGPYERKGVMDVTSTHLKTPYVIWGF